MFSLSAVAVFYARDVLGNADYYIAMTAVQTVAMVAAAALVPAAVLRIGKKRAYVLSGIVASVAAVGFALAPGSVPALGIACYGVLGVGFGAINALIFALQADTVEYGEWKSGVRAEGASYSVLSFTRKAGQGIGGAAAAYTMGIGGYVSGAAGQTDSAITSIKVAAGIVPAVAVAAATAVMLTYPLTERAFRAVVGELAERRAALAGSEPVGAST
jgi:glucuronide carrier protein